MSNIMEAVKASMTRSIQWEEGGTFSLCYRFPAEFPGFSGHFPDYPVLPAVVQVLAVLTAVEEAYGKRPLLVGLERAKFQTQIFPGEEIEVRCRLKEVRGGQIVEGTLTVNAKRAATLRLSVAFPSKE